jgi:hypothetical protein
MRNVTIAVVFAAFFAVFSAGAATRTWTGQGTNNNWSNPANWQDGTAPLSGDRLVFPVGLASTNDLGSLSFDSILIGQNSGQTFGGAAINLTGSAPITIQDGSLASFNGDVRIASPSATITLLNNDGSVETYPQLLVGTMVTAGGHITFNANGGDIRILGNIVEESPTSFTLNGGSYQLWGHNTFSGLVELNSGLLDVETDTALGTAAAGLVVNGGLVEVGFDLSPNSITIADSIALHGPSGPVGTAGMHVVAFRGTVQFLNGIDVAGLQLVSIDGDVQFKGPFTGSGKVQFSAGRPDTITLYDARSLQGGIDLLSVRLLPSASGVMPQSGDFTIGRNAELALGSLTQTVKGFSCTGDGGSLLGITAGAGMLTVRGASSLAGCVLALDIPFHFSWPANGEITLMRNESGVPFAGNFDRMPEGTKITDFNGVEVYVTYHGGSGNDVALLAQPPSPPEPPPLIGEVQDMWWAGSTENGWGMSLVQHNDTLFAAMYIYDANGKPTWLVMPGGAWDSTHTIYTGSLYTPVGTPFFSYDASRLTVGNAKGSLKITFQDANDAILDYTIGGVSSRKLVTREIFAGGGATTPDRSDLWWGGTAQNGWGITILQQASTLFPVWYTYDANGAATWYVMPGGTWTSTDTYEGHVYRTTGSPWIGVGYDPTKLQVFDVGTYRIQFTGDSASFNYTVDDHSGTIPLVKERF